MQQDTSTTAPTGGVALCDTIGCDGRLCAWCDPEKKSREGYAPDTAPPVAPPPPAAPTNVPKGWPAFCRCAVPHVRLTAGVRSCVTCDLVVGETSAARVFCRCEHPLVDNVVPPSWSLAEMQEMQVAAGIACGGCSRPVDAWTFSRAALSAPPSVPSVAPMSHTDRLHAELLEDHKHLARKVLEVLAAQRAYFASRAHADLIHAKALEGQLRSLATTTRDRTR